MRSRRVSQAARCDGQKIEDAAGNLRSLREAITAKRTCERVTLLASIVEARAGAARWTLPIAAIIREEGKGRNAVRSSTSGPSCQPDWKGRSPGRQALS